MDAPPLSQWDASEAIELWWNEKHRRQVKDTRQLPKRTPSASESELYKFDLDDWDSFIDNDSD